MRVLSTIAGIVATQYQMDVEGVEEFVAGLIYGLIQKDDLPEIQQCLKDSEDLEVKITAAISDISKGDFQDVLKAVEEIGQILKDLPVDLQDCQNIQEDVQKIENWAQIFEHPTQLVTVLTKNLLKNWKEVGSDIGEVTADYKAAKYYEAGEEIGDILTLSLGKISNPMHDEQLDLNEISKNLFLF